MTAQGQGHAAQECRVLVHLGEHTLFAYRADPVAAKRYVEAMGRYFPGLRVTIDDSVTPELRRLPGEILWSVAP